MRRLASKRERYVLFRLQDGRCAICGEELGDRFEVDHLVPFSENGVTKLCNLQALCLGCHSAKSREMVSSQRLNTRLS